MNSLASSFINLHHKTLHGKVFRNTIMAPLTTFLVVRPNQARIARPAAEIYTVPDHMATTERPMELSKNQDQGRHALAVVPHTSKVGYIARFSTEIERKRPGHADVLRCRATMRGARHRKD